MKIEKLHLENFRSYSRQEFDFSGENIHLLLGPNGIGKTNVLEAISILSLGHSVLTADEVDMVRWGDEFYRVSAKCTNLQLEVVSQLMPRKAKACYVNDVKKPMALFIGSLPTVIFLPQDLELFTGSPARRRQFLDTLLCQVSPEYTQLLSRYGKILRQRNSLLRKIAEGSARPQDLSVWDENVADTGSTITLKRLELLETLQCTLPEELSTLTEEFSSVRLRYKRKGEARGQQEACAELLSLLRHYRERDILIHSTTVGPHREDWYLEVDERDFATFASRGQQRTAVLALLFLEVSFLELQRGEMPVVLLDDVFSELDELHQQAVLRCLDEHQVIITATHMPEEIGAARVIDMEKIANLKSQILK